MSMIYCDRHNRQWDSDFMSECPACEADPSLFDRLEAEAELCQNEHADDVSKLLTEAVQALPPSDLVDQAKEWIAALHAQDGKDVTSPEYRRFERASNAFELNAAHWLSRANPGRKA